MTPEISAWIKLASFTVALAGLFRCLAHDDFDDDTYADAHNLVIAGLSDADQAGVIDAATGRDIRSQLSVSDALQLHEERELRRMGSRRN